MDRRQRLIEIFEDTEELYRQSPKLVHAVEAAKSATRLYEADDYSGALIPPDTDCSISVSKHKSFEAALQIQKEHPGWRIAVLNFASATNPGGGVKTGSSAQEECLCRCSTLYPTLTQDWLWRDYYKKNRDARDPLYTDACIYSPGIVICKTDESFPERMKEKEWITVDVISCAAPNLRRRPGYYHNPKQNAAITISPESLYQLHLKRGKHILHIAAAHRIDAVVLGAFGCGAFANPAAIVARAYKDLIAEYKKYFRMIEYAIYCRPDETENYDVFKKVLG